MNSVMLVRACQTTAVALTFVMAGGCGRQPTSVRAAVPSETTDSALPASTRQGRSNSEPTGSGAPDRAKAAPDQPLSQIFSESTRCEHGIPQYTCAECRYELGVVKVSPQLLATAGKDGLGTETAREHRMAEGQELTGEVQLDEGRSVYIGPRAPGVVRRILVDVGQTVRAGEVLFEVDSAELSDTKSELIKAGAAERVAQTTERREAELFDKKICPEKDLLEARATLEEARAAVQAIRERLFRLGLTQPEIDALSAEGATARGSVMPVRAPFAGTVLDRSLNLGATVSPGEKNLLLADTSRVWVMTSVYERELGAILEQRARGKVDAEVAVPSFPGRAFEGHVDIVGGTVDEATRTTKVRVIALNPDGLLRRGMFARVRLHLDTEPRVLAVPSDAVLSDEGQSFVFVEHDPQYFVRRSVRPGRTANGWTEIVQGSLEPGAVVVTRGSFLLKSDILRSKMGAGCAD